MVLNLILNLIFMGPLEHGGLALATSISALFNVIALTYCLRKRLGLLGGKKITVLEGDSTCVDSAAAQAAAEKLVSEGVVAIMGADCSGVTGAIASNVAVPKGVTMISPSATSP